MVRFCSLGCGIVEKLDRDCSLGPMMVVAHSKRHNILSYYGNFLLGLRASSNLYSSFPKRTISGNLRLNII